MATCAIALKDKRALARSVGRHLTARYGKRKHYSPPLIRATMRKLQFPAVWDCWTLSLFAGRADFNAYHETIGAACDYASMNTEMLAAVDSGSLFDFISGDWSLGDLLPDADSSSVGLPSH